MKINFWLALAVLVTVSPGVNSQNTKSLEQLQREELLNNAIVALDDFDAELKKLTKRRDSDCTKAIGYKPLCDCLGKDLPIAWSFSDYVAITTKSKEENGYVRMDKELRAAYDKVGQIRDQCVRRINKP